MYNESRSSPLGFWLALGVGSMFKNVRRLFFWSAIILFTYTTWLAHQATAAQWHQPFNAASHFWGDMQYWEVCFWLHVISICLLVMWVIMALFALIGRKAKQLITE
jgi:hypothetical protein